MGVDRACLVCDHADGVDQGVQDDEEQAIGQCFALPHALQPALKLRLPKSEGGGNTVNDSHKKALQT